MVRVNGGWKISDEGTTKLRSNPSSFARRVTKTSFELLPPTVEDKVQEVLGEGLHRPNLHARVL